MNIYIYIYIYIHILANGHRQLFPRKSDFNSRPAYVRFVVDKVALGHVSLEHTAQKWLTTKFLNTASIGSLERRLERRSQDRSVNPDFSNSELPVTVSIIYLIT
jgi:hypothetical protein